MALPTQEVFDLRGPVVANFEATLELARDKKSESAVRMVKSFTLAYSQIISSEVDELIEHRMLTHGGSERSRDRKGAVYSNCENALGERFASNRSVNATRVHARRERRKRTLRGNRLRRQWP
jgi:hypothetical protein